MKLAVKKGKTSKLLDVFIQDSSSTTGAGLTGLVYNTASLTAYYYREGAASATAITLATMTLGTWATGGFVVVDGTNLPGLYQLGIPDAALATGADSVVIYLKGAANMVQTLAEIQLVDYDPQDGVRLGLTAIPNAVAAANGGLPTVDASNAVQVQSGTGANQISLSSGLVTLAGVTHTGAVIPAVTTVTTATNLTNAPTAGDLTATMKTSVEAAVWDAARASHATAATFGQGAASVQGDVTGSVTGAVGSVAAGVTVTTNNDKGGYALSSAGVQAIWDALTAALTTVGSIGKRIADYVTGDAYVRLGAPAGSSIAADIAAVAPAVWDVPLASHLTAGTTGNALNAAGAAGDPWTTALPGAYGAGSAGYIVGSNLDAAVSTRLATAGYTAPLDAAGTRSAVGLAAANLDTQLSAIAGYIDTEVGTLQSTATAIKAKTDNLPMAPAATGDAMTLTAGERTSVADALLTRDWASVTGEAARSALNALRFLRNKWSISGGTLTVTKEDDTAAAWTGVVTTAAGDPASAIDPA